MTARESGPATFFEGVRTSPIVLFAIGGCLFLASFFVQDVHGFGRALGLFGIDIVLCGVTLNLLLQAVAVRDNTHHRRHLLTQAVIASLLAVAVCILAIYLCRFGHMPPFMPGRYDEYHVKRLT